MKFIYLEWEDAIANHSWFSEEEMAKWADGSKTLIKQAGWLYKETKEFIVLASRISHESDGTLYYGNLQKIPRTWVRKRKVIKL